MTIKSIEEGATMVRIARNFWRTRLGANHNGSNRTQLLRPAFHSSNIRDHRAGAHLVAAH
jgi:hypothetical protein